MSNPFSLGKIVGANIPNEEYLKSEGKPGDEGFVMSRSALMEFDHCPQRWIRGIPDRQTEWMRFGSLLDCLLTSKEAFAARFAVCPETYKNEKGEIKPWNFNAKVCQQWRDDQAGRTILKNDEMIEGANAAARLNGDKLIAKLLSTSEKQVCVTALYQDTDTDIVVPMKILVDLVPDADGDMGDSLADIKTDRNAEPRQWEKTVYSYDYHVQAAMYLDVFNSVPGGDHRTNFLHVIVENQAPFEPARRILSQEFIELGRKKYQAALIRYCRCLKEKVWPGYDDEGTDIIHGWRLTQPTAWMAID